MACTALSVFRRDPSQNRYVDPKFGVFRRVALGPTETVAVSADGLADSNEWHRAHGKGAPRYEGEPEAVRGERAVLIQSESHIATLCEKFPELCESFGAPGAFGENVLASGNVFDAKHVHIGDVFAVEGSTLLLQATSSRRPCSNVDIRHGKLYGNSGVRAFCARTGCAGCFFRVLRAGNLQTGAVFKHQFRQPAGRIGAQWSLYRLSDELYATANASYFVPRWTGSRLELRALCADRVLAEVEWKEVLVELLGRELEADGSRRAVLVASTVIWCALVASSWAYAPPVRPDWVDWCLDLVTMESWGRENSLVVAEFNMLGLWPLIILAQCRPYLIYRPTWFAPPLWLPLMFGLCLGCFAVAPTLALYSAAFQCTQLHLKPMPPPACRSPQPPACAYGLLLAACSLWYIGLAPFFRTYEAAEHWRLLQDWGDAVSKEGFAMVMSLDFVAFWVLSAIIAWAVERAEGGRGSEGTAARSRWWMVLQVPLVGSCAWLVDRCGERPSHMVTKLFAGWRATRQRIRNNRTIGSKTQ